MTALASTPDTELTLSFERQRAVVSPWGAALRRYFVMGPDGRETDIVWGYAGGAAKRGGQGDVLIPFPGRVARGRYVFDGQALELDCNDKEGPNAIHGFVRHVPWMVDEQAVDQVVFSIHIEERTYAARGYPFSLEVKVTYRLDPDGLSCAFAVFNSGNRPAPVGVGFHPYFTVGTTRIDHAEAKIPASGFLEFNDELTPTGTVLATAGTEWDYRNYRSIGGRRFNHCYLHLIRDADGWCRASLRNPETGTTIDVTMDAAFTAIVVYTGDAIPDAARQALAIEPMTCASDAFNHPDWGLIRLPAHETCSGRYIIQSRSR
jgi:aldose 1-epimerase